MKNQLACVAFLLGALNQYAVAQLSSLYVPGFDPQPISAIELGAGSDGSTTWLIEPGTPTGTFTAPDFVGTGTLIAGPSDAHFVFNEDGMDATADCAIANGLSSCTVVIVQDGVTSTEFDTETASPIVVQVGTNSASPTAISSSAPTPAPTSGSSGSTSVSGAPSQSVPTTVKSSSGSAGAPAPTNSTNGGVTMDIDRYIIVAIGLFGSFYLL